MTPYTYCFIRKDMPTHYQIIQAAHATQEITKEIDHPENTCHFILFEAKDEQDLIDIKMRLEDKGIKSHMFHEPDYDTGHTAIATEPIYGNDRRFFKKFKMFTA
jgi:hypothetical protein